MIHEVKIAPEFYELKYAGRKLFELRLDDRNYAVDDYLLLREWRASKTDPLVSYPGRALVTRITSVLRDHPGLAPGYAILGETPPLLALFAFFGSELSPEDFATVERNYKILFDLGFLETVKDADDERDGAEK